MYDVFCYRLGHPDIFQLINRHQLFTALQDKLALLMEFDKDQAVKMFIENTDKIPVSWVKDECESNILY